MKMKTKTKHNEGKVCRTFWIPTSVDDMIRQALKTRGFPNHWFSKWFTEAALGECALYGNLKASKIKEQFREKHNLEASLKAGTTKRVVRLRKSKSDETK